MYFAIYNDIQNGVCRLSRWQQHCVNHVNNTVVCHYISYNYLCIVDEYTVGIDGHQYILSVECSNNLTVCQIS